MLLQNADAEPKLMMQKADIRTKADAPAEKADAEPKADAPAEKANAEPIENSHYRKIF